MVQAKFLEREVWKPDGPEPDIASNKLRKRNNIKIFKVSQPRLLFYPGQQENANTNHQIGEPSDTNISVLKRPSLGQEMSAITRLDHFHSSPCSERKSASG